MSPPTLTETPTLSGIEVHADENEIEVKELPHGRYMALRVVVGEAATGLHDGDTVLVRLDAAPARGDVALLNDRGVYAFQRVGEAGEPGALGVVSLRWCCHD